MRVFYVSMAMVGRIVPWLLFGWFFAERGLDPVAFVQALFVDAPLAALRPMS